MASRKIKVGGKQADLILDLSMVEGEWVYAVAVRDRENPVGVDDIEFIEGDGDGRVRAKNLMEQFLPAEEIETMFWEVSDKRRRIMGVRM